MLPALATNLPSLTVIIAAGEWKIVDILKMQEFDVVCIQSKYIYTHSSYIYVCVCMCTYVCVYVYICVCVCVHMLYVESFFTVASDS